MAAHGEGGHGECEELGAVEFCVLGEMGFVIHAGTGVGPDPEGVGVFPFILADVDFVGSCGAVPVHALRRVAKAVGAVLPEAFAGAGGFSAVDAKDDGGRDFLGAHKQRRKRL